MYETYHRVLPSSLPGGQRAHVPLSCLIRLANMVISRACEYGATNDTASCHPDVTAACGVRKEKQKRLQQQRVDKGRDARPRAYTRPSKLMVMMRSVRLSQSGVNYADIPPTRMAVMDGTSAGGTFSIGSLTCSSRTALVGGGGFKAHHRAKKDLDTSNWSLRMPNSSHPGGAVGHGARQGRLRGSPDEPTNHSPVLESRPESLRCGLRGGFFIPSRGSLAHKKYHCSLGVHVAAMCGEPSLQGLLGA
ncbi:hypothetical protein EDD16DRAFT_1529233 [Pisolithus croceorrhizus]|nr:hypothetical protein EDD16DRAFT_1529233 [Pisolithus croceorrhizus]KAI6107437.1 hypothetical protein EV401DRAFT_1892081 [Pisolithus croceorrhizus]